VVVRISVLLFSLFMVSVLVGTALLRFLIEVVASDGSQRHFRMLCVATVCVGGAVLVAYQYLWPTILEGLLGGN
jgi:hypothetical protein